MTTQQQQPMREEDILEKPADSSAIEATETSVASVERPEWMSEEEARQIEQAASDIASQLASTKEGVAAIEIEDRISNLGIQAEKRSTDHVNGLLSTRVGQMLKRDKSREVTRELLRLRKTLKEISPTEIEKSFFRKIPIIGDRIMKVMETIAERYDSVSEVVRDIETKLKAAGQRTLQDNAELKVALEDIENRQRILQKHIYLGKIVVQKIDELISATSDLQRQGELREVLHNALTRVDALARVAELYAQLFVEIRLTRDTNNKLVRVINIAVQLGMNVVHNAMLLHSALQRQLEIMQALQQYKEFLETTMVSIAEMVKEHQGKVYGFLKEPIMAMDKIQQAHSALEEALKERDRFIQEGIESARTNIPKLEKMTGELMDRVKGVRIEEMQSIELESLPTRPVGGAVRPAI